MGKFSKYMYCAAIALTCSAIANVAFAGCYKDVVVSSNGNTVHDSFGNCVRTQWDASHDKCKSKSVYRDIMAMDERIIYFDFDKFGLKASEKKKLDALAGVLSKHKVDSVKIVGFTDRIGTHNYNDALSRKRANSVKGYLNSKVKLKESIVTLRALGESNQVAACDGDMSRKDLIECLAPNRRAEVEVDYYDSEK